MNLIIVESPTKAKTLNKFLGKDYNVEATFGHIKDLPKSKLSVDVENNFKPDYQEVSRQSKNINTLKKAAKKADKIFLATDPDREGEAISAHVAEIFKDAKIKAPMKRIVFHEITQSAVEEAIKHPRGVDEALVDAQIARRVLDRLVGYKVSPLLWRKVRRGLSAGRVQSVAVRLIVEREREIEAFKPDEYWEIASEVSLRHPEQSEGSPANAGNSDKLRDSSSTTQNDTFRVDLTKIDNKKAEIENEDQAKKIVSDLEKSDHIVKELKKREVKKNPYAPFTTSTMSQSAARYYGWSARKTMTIAQRLYEQGLITYHRTDSTFLSDFALKSSRSYIEKEFGKEYLPEKPRTFKTKSKSAQEAHEAIRVTDVNKKDTDIKSEDKSTKITPDMRKLYDMIWSRFVASQMKQVVFDQTSIVVSADKYELRTSGQIMKFDGWRRVMPLSKDEDPQLPEVNEGEKLDLLKVLSEQKFTQPPARYNEASLIKTLEKLGIGRPSTYAPVISTIQLRSYVEKQDKKFFATHVGSAVTEFLVKNFPETFDYDFTAQMEDNLDKVADGKLKWQDDIAKFYKPFEKKVEDVGENAERIKIPTEKLGEKCPDCGDSKKKDERGELVIRIGRFGKFISCSRFPDCKYTAKYIIKIDMECPDCGEGEVIVKKTKKGRTFYGCSRYPDCEYASWKNPQKAAEEGE